MTEQGSKTISSRDGAPEDWIIFGAGGHGREVAWLLRERWGGHLAIRFVVDAQYEAPAKVNGISVEPWNEVRYANATACVIAVGNPVARENIERRISNARLQFPPVIHPRVEHSEYVRFGAGALVFAGCVLTVDISIGKHVHINANCTVSHDVAIGDFVTLSPGVNIAGRVSIEKGAFLGANACIINGDDDKCITIGEGSIVGAGACVTRSVPKGARVVGVPAVER